jgi:hypothetical protein
LWGNEGIAETWGDVGAATVVGTLATAPVQPRIVEATAIAATVVAVAAIWSARGEGAVHVTAAGKRDTPEMGFGAKG